MSLIQKTFSGLIRKRAEIIGKQILPYVKDNNTVLDFGCGDMAISEFIKKKRKVHVTGIDVAEYNCTKMNMVLYKGGKLPFKNKQFDVVLSSFVLHHTDDPVFYFDELCRVSKKRVIIMEDTFANSFEKAVTYIFDWVTNHIESIRVSVPFNFRSISWWKNIIKSRNLKIKSMKRFYPHIVPFIPTRNIIAVIEKV